MNRNTKKTIIVPMDHGVSDGPIPGLIDMGQTVNLIADGGANAVIGHVGLALYGHRQGGRDIGLILHLSASTSLGPDPNEKVLVNSVTNALKMGADAVSMHVNIGAESEARMLSDLGQVAVECMEWGMPLLAMMYPRGKNIKKENDLEQVKLAARVAAELGADIVKTVYTGDPESFREVTRGCPVPVVVAGGSKTDDRTTLELIEGAMAGGAAGISIGRNAFQHRIRTSSSGRRPASCTRTRASMRRSKSSTGKVAEMIGKEIRIERIMDRNTGRAVIIPMDHGFSMGQIDGLLDMTKVITDVSEGGANAIVLHKGMVKRGTGGTAGTSGSSCTSRAAPRSTRTRTTRCSSAPWKRQSRSGPTRSPSTSTSGPRTNRRCSKPAQRSSGTATAGACRSLS